jgi:hypothetical protein
MSDERPLPPPIYGTRGEEWQVEPDEPTPSRLPFWIAAGIVVAVLVIVWL